ncbi:XRE family transcriptional regulator [Neobacillus sp. SCS-31]|uniref:XRE family transcriptional regulator n=1 Tax=Neobacillus oceani TaxID=3115292 RepID=UPI0039066303
MTIDTSMLAMKLKKYRVQFLLTIEELSYSTGIPCERLIEFELGKRLPTGDEILIISDFYKCDYKFFISNEQLTAFEQTELLFRRFGESLSKEDRIAIQEVLYLAECEEFLLQELGITKKEFKFIKQGALFKQHGIEAAKALRKHLNYQDRKVPKDVFKDFRSIGIHIFRRHLQNSNISGIYIKHPVVGKCILVNYNEDVYRQRFTCAHEVGHSILDDKEEIIVSFNDWDKKDLSEIRANTFASNYLLPPLFLRKLSETINWDNQKIIEWSNELKVSTQALIIALKTEGLINENQFKSFKSLKVPKSLKVDPELSGDLSNNEILRKKKFLELGLSPTYVSICFEALRRNIISLDRMCEMLLIGERQLFEIADLYKEVVI